VESSDAEKPSTSTLRLLCFLYQRRRLPLRCAKIFFTVAFTFRSRTP
jgi:hypothetical protein